jgi:hypothetical protein
MDVIGKHLKIASDRAATNPEVASANALAAIALLLEHVIKNEGIFKHG